MTSPECPICTEDLFANADNITSTHCGHLFHENCIKQWFVNSTTCPTCRKHSSAKTLLRIHSQAERTDDIDRSLKLHQKFVNDYKQLKEENEELKVKLLQSEEKLQKYLGNEKQHQDAKLRIAELEKENSKLTKNISNLKGNVSGLNRKINQLQKLSNSEKVKNAERLNVAQLSMSNLEIHFPSQTRNNNGVQEDVKLNESEIALKPRLLEKNTDLTEEERETKDLLNGFRSMLNKLTAENFFVLVNEVKGFKINTNEKLNGVISLLFEKAISEPKFAPTYAALCREMSNSHTFVEASNENRNQNPGQNQLKQRSVFKTNLINQCQREFLRHEEDSVVLKKIEEEMRQIESLRDSERDEKKASLEEEHFRIRQRANGTVKFIGELYKIKMLTMGVMKLCVSFLIDQPTEEKIEQVCILLTTIGSKMEQDSGPDNLNRYFDSLNAFLHPNNKTIRSSRIRFEIQNLQDLRRNKWKERRADPMTRPICDINYEAKQLEEQLLSLLKIT